MLTRSIAAALLAVATGLCAAQGASAPASPASPAKKELIQKVLQLQRPALENLGNTLTGQTTNQLLQLAGRNISRAPADKREALANDIKNEARKFFEEAAPIVREQTIKLGLPTLAAGLDEKFNEEELKALITWLESPVNRKYQQLAGDLQQNLAQKLVNDTRPMVEPKIRAFDLAVTKKLQEAGVQMQNAPSAPKAAASTPKK